MSKKSALSLKDVESAKPQTKAYRLHDAKVPGLSLRVLPSGVKSWSVLWARNRELAIGKFPGVTIEAARTKALAKLHEAATHGAPIVTRKPHEAEPTVADICRDYVAKLRKDKRTKTADATERQFDRIVYHDPIGKIKAEKLALHHLEDWRERVETGQLGKLPPRKGRSPTPKPLSQSSFNRMRTPVVAALNNAVARRKIHSDRAIEWESLKPYEAEGEGNIYIDIAQRRALLKYAKGDVRDLIECVMLTGCRAGDPAAVMRRDYDARNGLVHFKTKDHPRTIPVSPEAKALLDRLAKDKLPSAPMFANGDKPWKKDWHDVVKAVVIDAGLPERVTLKTLRHCWITDAITGGMDLLTVSKQAGTSLAMIEKTYGHLVQQVARDHLARIKFV